MNAKPKSRWETVMWVSMVVCLVAGLVDPLTGDDSGSVFPFVIVAMIAANIGWMRSHDAGAEKK